MTDFTTSDWINFVIVFVWPVVVAGIVLLLCAREIRRDRLTRHQAFFAIGNDMDLCFKRLNRIEGRGKNGKFVKRDAEE